MVQMEIKYLTTKTGKEEVFIDVSFQSYRFKSSISILTF